MHTTSVYVSTVSALTNSSSNLCHAPSFSDKVKDKRMRDGTIGRAAAIILLLLQCVTACSVSGSGDEALNETSRIKSEVFVGSDRAWLVTAAEGDLKLTINGGKDWANIPGQRVGVGSKVSSSLMTNAAWLLIRRVKCGRAPMAVRRGNLALCLRHRLSLASLCQRVKLNL